MTRKNVPWKSLDGKEMTIITDLGESSTSGKVLKYFISALVPRTLTTKTVWVLPILLFTLFLSFSFLGIVLRSPRTSCPGLMFAALNINTRYLAGLISFFHFEALAISSGYKGTRTPGPVPHLLPGISLSLPSILPAA